MRMKYLPAAATTLGDRQIRVIASDASPDRDGDILVPGGCLLDNYRKNPIVLANHDRSKPIGTATATYQNGRIEALITFAPDGASDVADEFCALSKAGVLSSVSVGFLALDQKPLGQGHRGYLITKWELLEISLVTVPANANATIVQRSLSKSGRVLSGANAGKLQKAHDAAENCRALVADVLAGAADDDNDGDEKRHHDIGAARAAGTRRAVVGRAQFDADCANMRQSEMLNLGPRLMTRSERLSEIRRIEMEGLAP